MGRGALASLSAAAVGARASAGARALAVTAAALELVLLGAFGQGRGARNYFDSYDSYDSSSDDLTDLARVLAPAIGALAELDRDETAAETAFFGASRSGGFDASSTEDERGGFAGGVCADGGRLRALVRRARDALAAFAPRTRRRARVAPRGSLPARAGFGGARREAVRARARRSASGE